MLVQIDVVWHKPNIFVAGTYNSRLAMELRDILEDSTARWHHNRMDWLVKGSQMVNSFERSRPNQLCCRVHKIGCNSNVSGDLPKVWVAPLAELLQGKTNALCASISSSSLVFFLVLSSCCPLAAEVWQKKRWC